MAEPTSSQVSKIENPSNESYSEVDYLRVRNSLVQILEEVKLRRKTDVENEERIKYLVKEKHQLECKYDAEVSRVASLTQKHQEAIRQIHRDYEDKMRQTQEEKSLRKLCKENVEKETKALKDEVSNLQLQKYALEKQLLEQNGKLQLQMSTSDNYLSQLSTFEQKFSSVAKQYHLLLDSQGRLERNVEQCVGLNKTLTYVNRHQKCLVELYCKDLEAAKQSLLAAKVQIQSGPAETNQVQRHLEGRVQQLEVRVKLKTEEVETKTKELETKETIHQKTVEELKKCYKLLEGHLEVSDRHAKSCKELNVKVNNLETEREKLTKELRETQIDLETEQKAQKQALQEWIAKEEELMSNLSKAETQVKDLINGRDKLEELNSTWAQKNLELTDELKQLQAIVNVEKVDNCSQVDQQTTSTLAQTDVVEMVSMETQVPSVLTLVTPTQTEVVVTSTCTSASQTDEVSTRCFGSQDHLCCQPQNVTSVPGHLSQSKGDNLENNLCCNQSNETCQPANQSSDEKNCRDIASVVTSAPVSGLAQNSSGGTVHLDQSVCPKEGNLVTQKYGGPRSFDLVKPAVTLAGNCKDSSASKDSKETSVLVKYGPESVSAGTCSTGATRTLQSTAGTQEILSVSPSTTSTRKILSRNKISSPQRSPVNSSPSKARVIVPPSLKIVPSKLFVTQKSPCTSLLSSQSSHSTSPDSDFLLPPKRACQMSSTSKSTTSIASQYLVSPRCGGLSSVVPTQTSSTEVTRQITDPNIGNQDLSHGKSDQLKGTQATSPRTETPVITPKDFPSAKEMGSSPSASAAPSRSCQLGTKSAQSCPPMDVNKQNSKSQTPPCSQSKNTTDNGASEELSPYSKFSYQLKQGYRNNRHLSELSQIQNFDISCTPSQTVDLAENKSCSGEQVKKDVNTDLNKNSTTPPVNLPKSILKVSDGLTMEKKTVKSVHFAGLKSKRPIKRPPCTDGDTPLFSDTEEDEPGLGSQINKIQAILSPDKARAGQKRKHPQP